ncbi:hypothetical protein LPB67_09645 [Undibacterium sp. Jales W-56]|uniref:c-type cytochrome n=1 Tax=Undibacterium sp. Jales W-56 TaxID=2897325 RepID=UPI0021D14D52|nr:hypothetical protein [Undibacterium sp. Jales W-56]MCU6434029.1 hypothetical protein [Undibacterium sp. Jales W-56]
MQSLKTTGIAYLRQIMLMALLCVYALFSSGTVMAADAVRGGTLFNGPQGRCFACHTSSGLADRTAAQITSAINSVSSMASLRRLSATDISDIAAYLGPVTPPPAAITPQTGWWWNPAEGGRGFTIEKQGNNIFMADYLYDPSGRASWHAAGPTATTGSTFNSVLTTYLGGQTLTGTFHPTTGTMSSGDISVTFTDPSHGTITWPGGIVPIERFDIVPGGASAVPPAGTPQAGWWWNPNEGGRGFSIEIQNGTMFLAGYMYDTGGNPIWYVSGPTAMTNTMTYQGQWLQYGNGQTLTGLYKPASIVNPNVGSITIQFSTTTTAVLTLPDGRQISIQRFSF